MSWTEKVNRSPKPASLISTIRAGPGPTVAKRAPSGLQSSFSTGSLWPIENRCSPVSARQMRVVASRPAVAIHWPSGLYFTSWTTRWPSPIVKSVSPESASATVATSSR